jgi:hypothetical protein
MIDLPVGSISSHFNATTISSHRLQIYVPEFQIKDLYQISMFKMGGINGIRDIYKCICMNSSTTENEWLEKSENK